VNGYFADFVLYPSPVAGSLASGLSGVAGSLSANVKLLDAYGNLTATRDPAVVNIA